MLILLVVGIHSCTSCTDSSEKQHGETEGEVNVSEYLHPMVHSMNDTNDVVRENRTVEI